MNPLYVWTNEDRQVSATMSAYFVNFVTTGDPNGGTLPAWPRASRDPARIGRQVIDVATSSVPFKEQARYEAAEPLLYMH